MLRQLRTTTLSGDEAAPFNSPYRTDAEYKRALAAAVGAQRAGLGDEPVPRSDVVALGPKVADWRAMALDQLQLAHGNLEILIALFETPAPNPELVDLVVARYRQHSAAGLDGLLAYSAVFDCSGSA